MMKSSLIRINLVFILLVLFIPNLVSAETKTFIKEYTYQASEDDSRNSSRTIALREVKRLLLEELGTYLESVTEVRNFQLTKDQITALTAGIIKTEIVEEKWDGRTYWLKSKIEADSDEVIQSIDVLRKDHVRTKELEEVRKRSDGLLRENEKLRKELLAAKGEKRKSGKKAYDINIKEIDGIGWYEKGLSLDGLGNHNDAIEAYSKAIELNPKDEESYYQRGLTYVLLDNQHQAIEDFSKALKLNPKKANFYLSRGFSHSVLGNHNQALEDADRAIKLDPKSAEAYYLRGLSYSVSGIYNQAIKDYGMAIKLNEKNADVYFRRGLAYCGIDKCNQAIKDYDRAIELDPKYAEAYGCRAAAYDKLGNHERALRDAKIAARLGLKEAQDILQEKGIDW